MPFIPHTADDVRDMLEAIGAPTTEALFDEIPARVAREVARRHSGRALRDGGRPADAGARRRGRPAAQLHRRGRLRAPRARRGLGDRHARRVLQRLHAVPGRGEPGHVAAALRIPVDDVEPDRHGGLERIAVRRRDGRCRGVPDGGARAPQVEVAARAGARRAESRLPRRAAVDRGQPEPRFRVAAVRSEGRPDDRREPREVPRRRTSPRS